MNYFTSHTGVTLPILCEDPYSISPVRFSRISGLLILPNGVAGPTDWTTLSGMEAIIDNTVSGNTTGKFFAGQGELPVGEAIEVEMGKNHEVNAGYEYNLTFESPVDSDGIRSMVTALQADRLKYTFWFVTDGGRINGGNTGISPHKTRAGVRYTNSDEGIETGVFAIQFYSDQDPDSVFTGPLLVPEFTQGVVDIPFNFTLQGAYSGPAAASSLNDGEYYYLSASNVLGYPSGIVMEKGPATTYASDTAAATGGVAVGSCYAVSTSNIYSLAFSAMLRRMSGTLTSYDSDSAAATGGVAVGEVYTLSASNIYHIGPPTGGLQKRRMS